MKYDIKAVETRYNNRTFRSRLEANWAAMFDLLGWEWEYEPFDLDGWLPDFQLHGHRHSSNEILVEVKPYYPIQEPESFKKQTNKIYNSLSYGDRFLFLGPKPEYYFAQAKIGTLMTVKEFEILDEQPAVLKILEKESRGFGKHFNHYDFTGGSETDYYFLNREVHPYDVMASDIQAIEQLWGHAKNKVKWVARNKR